MAGTSNPLTTSLNMVGSVNDTRDGWDNEDWGSLEEVPVSVDNLHILIIRLISSRDHFWRLYQCISRDHSKMLLEISSKFI